MTTASEALDAYIEASSKAWTTFVDYKLMSASEAQVHRANAAEDDALAALRTAIEVTR